MKKINSNYKIAIFIMIGLTLFIMLFKYISPTSKSISTEKLSGMYSILDRADENNTELYTWYENIEHQKGGHFKTFNGNTYAVISFGDTTKPNISTCFEKIDGKNGVTISYSFKDDSNSSSVKKYVPTPMIIKFNEEIKDVKFKEVPFK